MPGIGNIKKYEKAKEEIHLLERQFHSLTKTHKYKSARERGVKEASPKKQLFYNEVLSLRQSFLIEHGYAVLSEKDKKSSSKESIARLIVSTLPQLESIVDFRILDDSKSTKAAIRTESGDYELSFTIHKSPVVEVKDGIEVVGKLNPHVKELADKLTSETEVDVVRIKNNQITFAQESGNQLSLKITKKKKELF